MNFPCWRPLLTLCLASVALAAPSRPALSTELDSATFQLHLYGRPLGQELYSLQSEGDTLTVYAQAQLVLPGPVTGDTLTKTMRMVADAFDFDIRRYESFQRFRGQKLNRAILPHDTVLVVYREVDGAGTSDSYGRPPGRLFVMDGQIFSSFELMCRALHGHSFKTRQMHVFALSAHDLLTELTAIDLGTEVLPWGGRPVTTRKLSIGDEQTHYLVWMGPTGHMLKLEMPEGGLRLDREPPPVKRLRKPKA